MLLKITFCPLLRFVGFPTDAATPESDVVKPWLDVFPFMTKLRGKPLTVPPVGGGEGPVPFGIDVT